MTQQWYKFKKLRGAGKVVHFFWRGAKLAAKVSGNWCSGFEKTWPSLFRNSLQTRGGNQVSITWRYNSGVNANCGQTVVKRYPLKSCVFCLLS
jgi:hypothetical protein